MPVSTIKYFIERRTELNEYIFRYIFSILGVAGEMTDSPAETEIDIYYGNNCPNLANTKIIIIENPSDFDWQDILTSELDPREIGRVVEFDIIKALSELITDNIHSRLPDEAYDQHDRLIYSASFQSYARSDNIALINTYIDFIRKVIEIKCHIPARRLWPSGKKCAIGLSHDVDIPDDYACLKRPTFLRSRSLKWNVKNALLKCHRSAKYLFDRERNGFWLFSDIMDLEESLGFKSTFFFAAVNTYHEYGSKYDVHYSIKDRKFIEVFDEIAKRNFEIGLHASYNAYLNVERFGQEKRLLEKIAQIEVKGLRHHLWHMSRDQQRTLKLQENAGFAYDSSIAFNENMSFRRNIALPYHPWDDEENHAMNILELPVFCMDGNLFYHSNNIDSALKKLTGFISKLKASGGMGVIDWHVRTSYPRNSPFLSWAVCYDKLLKYLSNDREIWVENLLTLHDWWKGSNH